MPPSNPSSHSSTKKPSFSQQDSQPWYKNYMVTVFVIGLPLLMVIVCIWFIVYSVQVRDSVVRDDWYMDGKTLYQDVSRDTLMYELGLLGEMNFSHNNNDTQVTFILKYPHESIDSNTLTDGSPLSYPKELHLSISHATEINKDREATLVHVKDNQYSTQVKIDELPSKYYIEVSNEGDKNWRMRAIAKSPFSHVDFEPLPSVIGSTETKH